MCLISLSWGGQLSQSDQSRENLVGGGWALQHLWDQGLVFSLCNPTVCLGYLPAKAPL